MFKSFVIAGFECTVGRNRHGRHIDHIDATGHHRRIGEDYTLLRQVGIRSVRDGAPWRAVQERGGHYDWKGLDVIVDASEKHDIEVIYDFCHFGYPDDLDIFSDAFVNAFTDYCYEAALRLRANSDGPHFITPMNEPSYFAWAAGHAALFPPYLTGCAYKLKVQLARATLSGINAIWAAAPDAVIVNVDPICRVVAPRQRPDLREAASMFNAGAVLETWDMLSGKLHPELGGSRRHLGIIGINYYWTNQWELGSEDCPLPDDDDRRWPLHRLVELVWARYGGDLIIAETGHIDGMRASWVRELAVEAGLMLRGGVPLRGVCLYPILGMPAWHAPENWLKMGLWDLGRDGARVLHAPMLEALAEFARLPRKHPTF